MSAAMPDENAGHWRILTGVFAFMLASSVPMSFFYYVFPPMLRASGHSAELVSALALVYLPYVLRGVWAFAIARALGGRAQAWRRATLALSVLAAAGCWRCCRLIRHASPARSWRWRRSCFWCWPAA
ncbi:hypothetical protein ACTTAM_11385 [Rhodobacter capsulatus]|uniref:hypothetical protein n=1 Tax=Rhodobacter capsulatus TaxID=1061 RepID=UPI0040254BC2